MKKVFLLLAFTLVCTAAHAQSEIHKQAVDHFSKQLNDNDFEGIYQSFSIKMKKSKSKAQFFDIFSRVKRRYGTLGFMELQQYLENRRGARRIYNAKFENGNITIKITINRQSEIMGLYFIDTHFL